MPHTYPLFFFFFFSFFHEPYKFELHLYENANIVDKVVEDNEI